MNTIHRYRRFYPLCLAVILASSGIAVAQPVFVDVTEAAGLGGYRHYEPSGSADLEIDEVKLGDPLQMSGGAAVADYDGDGFLDLYVTRIDEPGILFRNRGDGVFEDRTAEAGLDILDMRSNGAGFADLDNDGDQDLYVTTIGRGRHYLFVNNGDGTFTEEAVVRGAAVESPYLRIGFSVSFGDYDRDGWLDIYVAEWRRKRILEICPPSHARLLRNRGADAPGSFEDVTYGVGLGLEDIPVDGVGAFAAAFSDLDDDGWPDLAITIDFRRSRLFWNNQDGTFIDGTEAAGVGTDNNGMGSTIGDYDGDGRLDWFVTSIFDPLFCSVGWHGNRLYRNEGNRTFSDRTDEGGVRDGDWGWGTVFLDYDNDGDLDLTMTNGVAFNDIFVADLMRFWRNDGGVFTEIAEEIGIADTGSGKGLLTFDYERDGDLDVFVVNNGSNPKLFQNVGGSDQSWLRVDVAGRRSNRDGLGAKVTVTPVLGGASQIREINSSGFFLGLGETTAHFGLGVGADPVAEVRVDWPLGGQTVLTSVDRNQTILIDEPEDGLPDPPNAPRPAPVDPPSNECSTEQAEELATIIDELTAPAPCDPFLLCPLSGFLGAFAMGLGLLVVSVRTRR